MWEKLVFIHGFLGRRDCAHSWLSSSVTHRSLSGTSTWTASQRDNQNRLSKFVLSGSITLSFLMILQGISMPPSASPISSSKTTIIMILLNVVSIFPKCYVLSDNELAFIPFQQVNKHSSVLCFCYFQVLRKLFYLMFIDFCGKRGCSVVHLLFHFSLSPYLVFLPLFIDLIIIHPIELVRPLQN